MTKRNFQAAEYAREAIALHRKAERLCDSAKAYIDNADSLSLDSEEIQWHRDCMEVAEAVLQSTPNGATQ